MIGKIKKGRSFKNCISYVFSKDEAKLIASEGLLTTDMKAIINSFYMQSLMNPNLSISVGHIPLSYAKEDEPRLTDAFMVQLAKEYMQAMKIENTQFIIVRHYNTDNPHCHIVFNRVDNNGKTISDKQDHYRNEKVCKQLKDKYNLTYGEGKEQTNIQKLKGAEKTKYKIYYAVKSALKQSKNWLQFESQLKQQGITIAYKMKGQSDEIQGISFKKGEHSFKGSDIDRKFSFFKLNNLLTTKQENHKEQKQVAAYKSNPNSLLDIDMGLPIQSHGNDWEEEQFKDRMEREEQNRQHQNKKKKRRKGFGF